MKIGIAGPIATEYVARHLDKDIPIIPRGSAGAPLLGTLITSLIQMGHEVTAYTLDHSLNPTRKPLLVRGPGNFQIYYCASRQHSFRPNGRFSGRMLDFFRVERAALQMAMETDAPEVVHAHWTYEYALAAIQTGIPHVITCHDSPIQVLRFMPNLYRLGRYAMARRVFYRAKSLSAVSPYLQSEVSKYSRVPIVVVPNPVPVTLLSHADRLGIRSLHAKTPKIAMILNGWGSRKNPQPALEAFALLRHEIPDATLHLYGHDFGPGERADIWATRHELRENVAFHGLCSHEQLMRELEQMDMLLHPSLEEAMVMAITEAMFLGTPVVGGDQSGGVPWLLDYGKAGVLTDVRDPVAICKAMLDLLKEPDRYQRLSAAARSRAHSEFDPKIVAERYLQLYHEAVKGQAHGYTRE